MKLPSDFLVYASTNGSLDFSANRLASSERKRLENVIYVCWEESERNWGVRPDGCSLHLNRKDYQQYIKEYWKNMPDETPDEYSRPASEPTEVLVSKRLFRAIRDVRTKYGLRIIKPRQDELEVNRELVFMGERLASSLKLTPREKR